MDEDLGSLVAPQQQGGWTSLLSDPVARSALLGFGLQAMTGGWGNGTQQLAAALGAGAQSAEGTGNAIRAQAVNNRDFQAKQEEGAANRASHEKIAEMGAASREEVGRIRNEGTIAVAQERVAGMLERARLIHGPQNDKEMQIFAKARTDYMKKEKDNQLLSKKSDDQILTEADAYAKEQLRGAREAVGVRSQGSALPNEATTEKPKAAAPGQPAPTAGPSGTGLFGLPIDIGVFPPRAALGSSAVLLQRLRNDPQAGPQFNQDMQTPEGRARILQKFPQLKGYIPE